MQRQTLKPREAEVVLISRDIVGDNGEVEGDMGE
jgi:hypothetical protein